MDKPVDETLNATRNSNSFDGMDEGVADGLAGPGGNHRFRDESVIDSFPQTVVADDQLQNREPVTTGAHQNTDSKQYETFGGQH